MDQRFDKEYVKENVSEYLVEIQESEIPLDKMPSYSISNHAECKKQFLHFMELDEEFAEEIWKLMKSFPENKANYEKMCRLNIDLKETILKSWYSFLEINGSINKLLDNIYTLKNLLLRKRLSLPSFSSAYIERFVEMKGFDFLKTCYLEKVVEGKLNNSYTRTD
jgi:hypothetical protein